MPYLEAPNVINIQRKYFFPEITWIDVDYFKEIESKNDIKPFIIAQDSVTKMYIGKTVPTSSPDYRIPISMNEIIGTVLRDLNGNLVLRVPYGSSVYEVKDNFVVLSIKDESSFEWKKDRNGNLPSYALRGSLDCHVNEFLYIGRTLLDGPPGKCYQNGMWNNFDEIVVSIGKIHSSHKCLYCAIGENEVAFNEYEILCLKPSPASLKVLCRMIIRDKIGYYVNKIKEKLETKLPNSLIQYLEYPSKLCYGEYLLKGEKLISECGSFELFINNRNEFICNDNKKNVRISTIPDIQSFYLHHNKIVMCHMDCKLFDLFANINFNVKIIPNEYSIKLFTDNDFGLKYFLIEIYDSNGNVIHREKIYRSIPIDVNEQYERLMRQVHIFPTNNYEFNEMISDEESI